MTKEERYVWEKELGRYKVLTHAQARTGASLNLPPNTNNPLAVIREYRRSKQKLNPARAVKNQMMREGNLSSRQWRKFRKQMNRATREIAGGN
jgi:hypothetical protein